MAALPGYEEASPELVSSVLEEAGRVAAEIIAPLNHPGDKQGARLTETGVRTADGWAHAYKTLVDGNWIGLSCSTTYGGMGLPDVVGAAVSELWQAANMAFALCPMLTQGAINAISRQTPATGMPKPSSAKLFQYPRPSRCVCFWWSANQAQRKASEASLPISDG